jgi:ubiquinone/menaquinone biosynthesis C-methylase UbiE
MIKGQLESWIMNSRLRAFIWRFESKLAQKVFQSIKPFNISQCLEIGTGQGLGAIWLMRLVSPEKIIAINYDSDQSLKAIENISKSGFKHNILIKEADATNLPFADDSFDMVIAFCIFHHIPKYEKALKEVYRVLKRGGIMLLEEAPKREYLPFFRWIFPPERIFSKKELVENLKKTGFQILQLKDHPVHMFLLIGGGLFIVCSK